MYTLPEAAAPVLPVAGAEDAVEGVDSSAGAVDGDAVLVVVAEQPARAIIPNTEAAAAPVRTERVRRWCGS